MPLSIGATGLGIETNRPWLSSKGGFIVNKLNGLLFYKSMQQIIRYVHGEQRLIYYNLNKSHEGIAALASIEFESRKVPLLIGGIF